VDQAKIERALDACYDAILTPETWSHALHQVARSVDAACAAVRAAMLLDWRGVLVRLNAQADRLLGTDLCIRRGKLTAQEPCSNLDLRRLVAAICVESGSRADSPQKRVLVRRPWVARCQAARALDQAKHSPPVGVRLTRPQRAGLGARNHS
jgi:hypothetical protein